MMKKTNRYFIAYILSTLFWGSILVVLEIYFHISLSFWINVLFSVLTSGTVLLYAWCIGDLKGGE